MDLLAYFLAKKKGGGGGGEVTAAAVVEAIEDMSAAQKTGVMTALGAAADADVLKKTAQSLTDAEKTQSRSNISAGTANPPAVVTVTGTSPEIAAEDNKIYVCSSEVSTLTISGFPANGWFHLIFTSGASPTVLNLIQALEDNMPDDFTAIEANTRYEFDVLFGYPLVSSKAVSSS